MFSSRFFQEQTDFNDAVRLFGTNNVTEIQKAVGTRSRPQIRNRIQKVRKKKHRIIINTHVALCAQQLRLKSEQTYFTQPQYEQGV